MSWVTYPNDVNCTGSGSDERDRRKTYQLKVRLLQNGWTLLGSGDGNSSYSTSGTDYWTSYSAVAVGAWLWLENTDGLELVIWHAAAGNVRMRVSPGVGYSAGTGEDANNPVGTSAQPSDELRPEDSGSDMQWTDGFTNHYCSFAVESDGTGFIVFGRVASLKDSGAAALVKLDSTQVGDSAPYWFYRRGALNYNWTKSVVQDTAAYQRGLHPSTGEQAYGAIALSLPVDPMSNIPVDPISGDVRMYEVWAGCVTGGSEHLRGRVPGLYRVSEAFADGTKIYSDQFIVLRDFAFPWNSSDPMNNT